MSLLLWVRMPTLLVLCWRRIFSRRSQRGEASQRRSLIVFRLDALGDLTLTTPVFRELKRSFPDSWLTVTVQAAYSSVLTTNPHIDELLFVQPVRAKLLPRSAGNLLGVLRLYWRDLRGRSFDAAITPRWDTDEQHATLLCLLTNAAERIGYSERASEGKRRYNRGFDHAFDVCVEPGPLQHEVLRNLAVVEAAGGNVRDRSLKIHLADDDRRLAATVLENSAPNTLRIALGIGAQSPGRRWPLERYAACLSELAHEFEIETAITCAPAEHGQASLLAAMIAGKCVISDSAEIRETCALLERCHLYIGNDTGAAHLAAAMGCATMVISRHPKGGDATHPNSPSRFAPYCAVARVIQPDRGLGACTQRCTHIEPHCIEQVSVPEVVAAVREVLAITTGGALQLAESVR